LTNSIREVWQFEDNIYDLVELCTNVLSDKPLFFLINSYTTGISATVLENILKIKRFTLLMQSKIFKRIMKFLMVMKMYILLVERCI